jgi:hypothetical protein
MTASESWNWVIAEYQSLIARNFVELAPLLRLAERMAGTPQAAKLRAGLSMSTLLISATDEPLSQVSEPFIALRIEPPDGKRLRVQYQKMDGPVLVARVCEEDELQAVLQPLFFRLWNETSKRTGIDPLGDRP